MTQTDRPRRPMQTVTQAWIGAQTRMAGLRGWPRHLTALGLGVAAALGLAPYYLFPAMMLSFTGLMWLLDGIHASSHVAAASRAVPRWRQAFWPIFTT